MFGQRRGMSGCGVFDPALEMRDFYIGLGVTAQRGEHDLERGRLRGHDSRRCHAGSGRHGVMNREPDGQPEDGNSDEKAKFANERSTHFYFYAQLGGTDARKL